MAKYRNKGLKPSEIVEKVNLHNKRHIRKLKNKLDMEIEKELINQDSDNNIYFMRVEDTPYFKIGISKNPNQRRKGLQIGNPKKINLFLKINTDLANIYENILHDIYVKENLQSEWFEIGQKAIVYQYKNNPIDTLLGDIENHLMNRYPMRYGLEGYSLIMNYKPYCHQNQSFSTNSRELSKILNMNIKNFWEA